MSEANEPPAIAAMLTQYQRKEISVGGVIDWIRATMLAGPEATDPHSWFWADFLNAFVMEYSAYLEDAFRKGYLAGLMTPGPGQPQGPAA